LPPLANTLRIACLGECMVELSGLEIAQGNASVAVAGDTLNTAIYLRRCLGDAPATIDYMTALGEDALSTQMCEVMEAQGVGAGRISRLPDRLPGIYAIELDADGERRFHYWRAQSAARSMFGPGGLTLDLLDRFEVIYLSGITLAILPELHRAALITKLKQRKAEGAQIVFDSNYRPRLWDSETAARDAMGAMWQASTLALPSLDDECALWGDANGQTVLERIGAAGVGEIALKQGAEGPLLAGHDLPALPRITNVVDTTAAGDAFNGAYLAARLSGGNPAEAARAGHALACAVVQWKGAILPKEGMPGS